MSFLRCSSIYDIVNIFQIGFFVPDVTRNADSSASTSARNIGTVILIQVLYASFGYYTFTTDKNLIVTDSAILDGGLNFTLKVGYVSAIVGRQLFFWYRYKLWEIVRSFENCDNLLHRINVDLQLKVQVLFVIASELLANLSPLLLLALAIYYATIDRIWLFVGLSLLSQCLIGAQHIQLMVLLGIFKRLQLMNQGLRQALDMNFEIAATRRFVKWTVQCCSQILQHLLKASEILSFIYSISSLGIAISLSTRIFAYISVYRALFSKYSSLPSELPVVFVICTENYYIAYIFMMIAGHKIEREQLKTLNLLKKLINKTTDSELVEDFSSLAEAIASYPIKASCGFFVLNLELFLSVRSGSMMLWDPFLFSTFINYLLIVVGFDE